ncbi:MAG: YqiJ family protein [Hydrogenophaga sp.]|uniref:YqiJ family protein n=1 Tax=Hydrogenophaga sp. TaxID=1904254 RepID=UPI002726DC7D|nr:YqiJ family protein [Hydrogenophaga sp.]MDO9483517.1 YqiJ family protein [Hydrogenophaga sp.]MDP3343812.1 YqiJ family protein [Hydrogenophaga sp.]MDP3808497.1 YqiJ family protein [Hydrogenophaga sp.]MDP3924997.1 YqiJ family protein [Hydrogenophaga sp.]MDZ4239139.1 YqiJ family protein [Hydrogenophaga sp.]
MIWFAQETWPFGSALLLMLALFIMEGAGLLFAASPSSWLDGLVPDLPDSLEGPLAWLHVGKVPFLILLGIFLAGFSMSGYAIQAFSSALFGQLMPAWLAAVPAMLGGMSLVRGLGGLLARLVPSDETSAVSEMSLIGRAGLVVQGTARQGSAAQMKLRDMHGRTHYVLVEPDLPGETFEEGVSVLLVKKNGARYMGIRNPHPELL